MITFLLKEPVFQNYGNFLQRKVILSPKRISDLSLSLSLSLSLCLSLSEHIPQFLLSFLLFILSR